MRSGLRQREQSSGAELGKVLYQEANSTVPTLEITFADLSLKQRKICTFYEAFVIKNHHFSSCVLELIESYYSRFRDDSDGPSYRSPEIFRKQISFPANKFFSLLALVSLAISFFNHRVASIDC